jgi:hypothetical protein
MVEIKIKSKIIEPLFLYNPKLNEWHKESHKLDYQYCVNSLKTLEPIKKEMEGRGKNAYGLTGYKLLRGVFMACKPILKQNPAEDITISFIEEENLN